MSNMKELFEGFDDFACLGGVSEQEIEEAEEILGLKFAEDYKEFLRLFGAASVNTHEIIGLCKSKRLNVIDNTVEIRDSNPDFPANLYAIEHVGMDGILMWEDADGCIYQSIGGNEPEETDYSFVDYITETL